MNRKTIARALLVIGAVGTAWMLSRDWPHEQPIVIRLDDRAGQTERLAVRIVSPNGDTLRETRFQYAKGAAPRAVDVRPSLANGSYAVEVEVESNGSVQTRTHHVTLQGSRVTIYTSR